MCGICGIIHLDNKPVRESSIREMMDAMKHRGPDDDGVFMLQNIGFGFVRLSIIDLSYAGHQPMISDNGRYVIVFNGEIYNYIELRKKLKDFYTFRSNTDTEVLLAAYMKWGKQCLEMLNGMFAFVILDTQTRNIFAARDRFGIKPFYYTVENNSFYFASDIPPIVKVLNSKPLPNYEIISDFLLYKRTDHNNQTFFKEISKLQHGHYLEISGRDLTIKRWYNLIDRVHLNDKSVYSDNMFFDDLSESVELQLRSDVPVGTCFSGGLDSSAITSLVKLKSTNPSLHTFSAVYGNGVQGDESNFIKLFSDKGLKMHFTTPSADSLIADLGRFQEALSEPTPNTSEYAEFKVMELAKEYCTVILNGQGADEMMAGYHYFYGYYFKDLLKGLRLGQLISEMSYYLQIHKSFLGIKSFGFALQPKWFRNINSSSINGDFLRMYSKRPNPIVDDFYSSKSLKEFLIKHFEYKFEHHLLWADKSGMYFSLETRFPFLDHNLIERTLASGVTIKKGNTKHLLRESMKGIIPEKIRSRTDKIGYQTPEELWFKDAKFKEYYLDIMNSSQSRARIYLDKPVFNKAINDYQKGNNYNSEFWKWFSLELWMRKFID